MKEIKKIESRDNLRLVNARKVRDGKVSGQVFVEGRRLVEEALNSDLVIEECFVVDDFRDRELVAGVSKKTDSIAEIPNNIFKSIADTQHSQGIILIAKRPETSLQLINSQIASAALPIVIFLNEVNNPSNLGAIMRTAEAVGTAGVIISKNSADVFSPKALRAAMGASFRLPILDSADFDEVLRWAREGNLATTATDTSDSKKYTQVDWNPPRLLIFGSEAHGLATSQLEKIDEKIWIPMENDVESLNLAVSAGIILFEAKRQYS